MRGEKYQHQQIVLISVILRSNGNTNKKQYLIKYAQGRYNFKFQLSKQCENRKITIESFN